MEPDKSAARRYLGVDPGARVLALMPGSRASEIKLLAPRFLQAAQILLKQDPDLQILLPMVNAERRREFHALLEQYPVRNCRISDQAPTPSSGGPAVSAQHTHIDTRPAAWYIRQRGDPVSEAHRP